MVHIPTAVPLLPLLAGRTARLQSVGMIGSPRRRAVTAAVVLTLLGNHGCASRTTTAVVVPSDWSVVQSLPRDARIRVAFRWGDSVVGTVEAVDEERIRLTVKGTLRDLKRTDVTRVWRQSGRQTARYRRRGAIVGLAAGTLTLATGAGGFGLLLTAYWIGLGAALGAITGYATREETLVFAG